MSDKVEEVLEKRLTVEEDFTVRIIKGWDAEEMGALARKIINTHRFDPFRNLHAKNIDQYDDLRVGNWIIDTITESYRPARSDTGRYLSLKHTLIISQILIELSVPEAGKCARLNELSESTRRYYDNHIGQWGEHTIEENEEYLEILKEWNRDESERERGEEYLNQLGGYEGWSEKEKKRLLNIMSYPRRVRICALRCYIEERYMPSGDGGGHGVRNVGPRN